MQNFTEDELAIAKSVDLVAVASSLGYTPKRIGNYYTLKEMDSMRIYNRSHWCRFSRRYEKGENGGSQIDFLRVFAGMDVKEAVFWLLDFAGYRRINDTPEKPVLKYQVPYKEVEKKPFVLPQPAHSNAYPHSHIVFNSVSFRDGKKYHYQKGDWEKYIQPITNRLCKEYGLSTIEIDEETGKRRGRDSYQEWNSFRDGKFVWSRMVARDVDACIIQAASFESFVSMFENKGYEVKNANGEGKYLAVKPQGMKRFVRLKSLGEEYTEERIRQRIYEENITSYIKENKPRIVYCRVRRYKRAKMSGLQKKYYARLYRIGKLKKKAYSVAWKYRDEIKKMQKLQAQYQFLLRHNIHSVVDLALVEDNLTDKRKEASAMKSRIYRANSKNKELYDIANEMEELLECENSYRNGDVFFEDEHNRWLLLESRLKELGYSYDEVKALKEHYRSEGAKLKSLEQEASKELKLAESIRKDFVGTDGQEVERQQEEVKEQNMEHEKQPRR